MSSLLRLPALPALAIACALFAPPVAAQQVASVSGRVTGDDGRPVDGAVVSVVSEEGDLRREDETDGNGRYRVQGLPAGAYRVEVRGFGYAGAEPRRITLAAGEAAELDFVLSVEPFRIAGVEGAVRRDRFERTYAATRMETEVSPEIPRDFNPANNYDALRLVPGVSYLWASGGRFGKPSRIRGASTWAIADVIEDFPSVREAGIGAEDGGLTADFGSVIPAVALAGIEVKKGSLGVLYGADADGGVIVNQLQRGMPGAPQGELWIEASPLGEQLYMADAGIARGGFDVYAAGKWLDGDYDEFVDERGRVLREDELRSGLLRAGWEPFTDGRLELIAVGGRDRIHYTQPVRDDPNTPGDESETLPADRFRTTNTSAFYGLTFDHAVSSAIGYEVGYSLFEQHALRFSLTEGEAHRDRPETSHTVFGNLYWNRDLGPALDLSLKGGFEWMDHTQEENARGSDKEQSFTDRSVFLASTLLVDERLTLSGGLRFVDATDDFRDETIWVHDLGAAYDFAPTGTRLVASWSTGYSRNKGFAYFFGPIREAGGVGLSENTTVEASVEQSLPSPWEAAGHLTVTGFRMWNDRVPVFSGWGDQVVYTEDREVDGVEVQADYPLGGMASLAGSLTWMDSEVVSTTHPDGNNVGSTGVQVPRWTGALALQANPIPTLDLFLIGTYDDGMRLETVDGETGEVTVTHNAGYTRLNLASEWRAMENVAVRFRVENLLDQEDLGFTSQTLRPGGQWETTETLAEDPGRIFSLGLVLSY